MSEYLIVATWNGDDLESNNTIEIVDLKNDRDARNYIKSKLKDEDLTPSDFVVNKNSQDANVIEYECNLDEDADVYEGEEEYEDAGSYSFFKLDEGAPFAVAIQCNINHVVILQTNLDYEEYKELHFDDNDEVEYLEVNEEYEFVDDGDLYHKIIKL